MADYDLLADLKEWAESYDAVGVGADGVLYAAINRIEELIERNKQLEAALRGAYKDCLNAVEKVKSDPFTELGVHHKGKWGDTTARDWMVAFAEDVEREIKARAALGEKKSD